MATGISIHGIPQVMALLQLKKENINTQIKDSMNKAGNHIQNEVKSSISGHEAEPTSVDTGRFLGSVEFQVNKEKVIVFSNVPYAKYLEFGTSRLQARKHFENSLNRSKIKVINIIREEIKNI